MNATKARGTTHHPAPLPDKGVFIKGEYTCSNCANSCSLACHGRDTKGGYTLYDEVVCKQCARSLRII